jgi:hypothetical protein
MSKLCTKTICLEVFFFLSSRFVFLSRAWTTRQLLVAAMVAIAPFRFRYVYATDMEATAPFRFRYV